MRRNVTATVVDGRLSLDETVDFPDDTRVLLTIEALPGDASRRDAVEAFLQLTDEHPIDSGGLRYTREQLHERD